MSHIEENAQGVILELINRHLDSMHDGDDERRLRLHSLIGELSSEFPKAKMEINKKYGI